MEDYLIKAIALDGKVRAYAIDATNLVNELQQKHQTLPIASAALGRATTIGALMGAMMKGKDKLTIQIQGDGPLGQIVVDANAAGEVRGYVTNPKVDLPNNENGKLDVAGAIGKGNIFVIKDLGLKESYRGNIPIISGELGEDFTYYFVQSEQTPSAVAVGVLVNPDYSIRAAGGIIIQILPGITDEEVNQLEKAISKISSISSLIDQGLTPEHILGQLFHEQFKVIERINIQFTCNCSRDRIENTLIQLGKEELEDMIEKEGEAEVICQFCSTKYHFNKKELSNIIAKL